MGLIQQRRVCRSYKSMGACLGRFGMKLTTTSQQLQIPTKKGRSAPTAANLPFPKIASN